MIEHLPKLGNVPRLKERQGVDGIEEGPFCKRRDWWNNFSSPGEGVKASSSLRHENLDEHCSPLKSTPG